ncbi:MAG TPA: T9SS type A sorting domain-containing protein, partial [Bacteroidia bacterium]|nr:T9SS type A sorting domain-containing protein [Bacteroidia bacterium]
GYNNQGISANASCADFFTPPVAGYNYAITLGSAYAPSTYNKRQASGGFNSNEGSVQQLPNGNILLCMGISGYIKEFDPSGALIWTKTLTGSSAKAFRYSECYTNNAAPSIPNITENSGVLSSDPAATYQWYFNGQLIPGETNQSITPTQDGIYLVRITDSNGCVYQYSKGYHFTIATGIKENTKSTYNVFPNPSSGIVNITELENSGNQFELDVFEMSGRKILNNKTIYQINLEEFGPGIYTLQIKQSNNKSDIFKVVITD